MNSQEPGPGLDSPGFEPKKPSFDSEEPAGDLDQAPIVPSPVNYDDEGLTEVSVGEIEYRFDAGKQGTALCLSERSAGTYAWRFVGEVRWDGRDLRSRELARGLLGELSLALRKYVAETAS